MRSHYLIELNQENYDKLSKLLEQWNKFGYYTEIVDALREAELIFDGEDN